ncbi:MAG: redoxin [Draconibacterium sp.]|nr:MAG: redoxin [Draconibacterium sp.]PIF05642.1 MAG: redoxin [Draconibacterium sp.]
MKFILSILFTIISTTGIFAQLKQLPVKTIPEKYGFIVKIGQDVPDISFKLTNGKVVKSSEWKGKVVMLQFTASWCGVCRKEMPHIESDIWQKHKNNPDFKLFGIDMDEPVAKVKKFANETKITYPLALDPQAKIFYTFAEKGAGVTRNIIIDKAGKIVYMTRLYKKDEFNEMVDVIDFLLKN